MDKGLKAYQDFLLRLAEIDSRDIISNGGKEHAALLYSTLLDKTENEVRIFCQSGASEVWRDPHFVEAMKNFLQKPGTLLRVLTAGEPALDKEWTMRLNVKAHHILDKDRETIYRHFRNDRCNFAVFDLKRYRYEYDCARFKAYGSFNDPDTAGEMIALFDSAFKRVSQRHPLDTSDSLSFTVNDGSLTIDSYRDNKASCNEAGV